MSQFFFGTAARKVFLLLVFLLAALGLICFPAEAVDAGQRGLLLCYRAVLPSLFPFFVLSTLAVDLGLAAQLGRTLEGVMRPLFHLPGACASALILGLVGGYPVGAKTAIGLYAAGSCTKSEAERLLAFCNNAGPAFIFGVVGAGIFASVRAGLLLYLVHICASLLVGVALRFVPTRGDSARSKSVGTAIFTCKKLPVAFTGAVQSSFMGTLNVCAFVVFFTVVLALLTCSGLLPALARCLAFLCAPLGLSEAWFAQLLTGLLELTTGVQSLASGGALAAQLAMAAFFLGWAGLSVHAQVLALLESSGLSARGYLFGKLLHGGVSALLISLFLRIFPQSVAALATFAGAAAQMTTQSFPVSLFCSSAVAASLLLLLVVAGAWSARKTSGK